MLIKVSVLLLFFCAPGIYVLGECGVSEEQLQVALNLKISLNRGHGWWGGGLAGDKLSHRLKYAKNDISFHSLDIKEPGARREKKENEERVS